MATTEKEAKSLPLGLRLAGIFLKSKPRKIMMPRAVQASLTGMGLQGVTVIPPIAEKHINEIEVQTIQPGYSYVRIKYDTISNEYLYEVIEPVLTTDEEFILDFLKGKLIDAFEMIELEDPKEREKYLRELAIKVLRENEIHLNPVSKERILYYVVRDFIGYGLIGVPMIDPNVEDISCDGVRIPIYIFHRKYGSIKSNLRFQSHKELDGFVVWLVQRCGKHISVASPMVDATVPDGSRLQATLGEHVTKRGSSFTIRRFRENPFTPVDLLKFKTMSTEMMAYIWIAIESGQSMMVCGGTASGKTTTLNAVLLFIPPQMKIVSIEDTRELNLPHENWIPSLTRSGFGGKNLITGKAAGEIDMFDLLTAALRQRPQYLMVGEVRGAEAYIVFQAMATGKTCYTTFHAESVAAMVHRMENPPINLPRALVAALNIVLLQGQVKVGTKMTRRVKNLTEIVGIDPETNELITNSVYSWNPADDTFSYSGHSYVYEKVAASKNWSMKEMEREVKRRCDILEYMKLVESQRSKDNPFTYKDVARLVSWYYKEPDAVMETVRQALATQPQK
ncbi:MAG: type II/IV secretion system ATPase subunit [Thermoplasmata archaeon]|nr:type II/IV secretion system ATPase subunit [Thermoplasmata archaeon]